MAVDGINVILKILALVVREDREALAVDESSQQTASGPRA